MKRTLAALLIAFSSLWPTGAGAEPQPSTDKPLPCIRRIESRGNYRAVSSSGKYRGAYQADQQTWNANMAGPHPDWVGVRPDAAPEDIQDSFARVLHHRRGLQPWCAKVRRECR